MKNIKISFIGSLAMFITSSLLLLGGTLISVPLRAEAATSMSQSQNIFIASAIPSEQTNFSCGSLSGKECLKKNPIVVWLNWGLTVLSAIVGVGAIIMTIVAGLQYSASRDNPQGVQAAKLKITNVVIGLAAYIFLWAFLNWLIPGGPF